MDDIARLLDGIGLSQYLNACTQNDIDANVANELTADDLKEIGVVSLGHRKRLLALFASLSSADDPVAKASAPDHGGWAERREVTTVFADLTGYTSLSREMETEDLHEVLSAFFDRFNQIVTRMGGTVDRHIGDCVMAVFGAPVSHGNDAERALHTTIEMHKAMEDVSRHFGRPLNVHIGAAAGNVLFSTHGYGQRKDQDFTLTGDTVNLASRLADMAKPGETLIDDHLFLALSHIINCGPPVALDVKGFDAPVLAHRLIDFLSSVQQGDIVGRDTELEVFKAAFDACALSGHGQTLYLVAEPGIGKSRLLREVTAQAMRRGFETHSALVLDFGLGGGESPVNALVGKLCGLGQNAHQSAIDNVVNKLVRRGALD